MGTDMKHSQVTEAIIGAAMAVLNTLRPGRFPEVASPVVTRLEFHLGLCRLAGRCRIEFRLLAAMNS